MTVEIDSNLWWGTITSAEELRAAVDAVAWAHRNRSEAVDYFRRMRGAGSSFSARNLKGVRLRDITPPEWWTELEAP